MRRRLAFPSCLILFSLTLCAQTTQQTPFRGAVQAAAQANATARTSPAVSPDGSRIAYASEDDIFVVHADGSSTINATHSPDHEAGPGWTRDGHLTYSIFADNKSRVFIADNDGAHARVLATVPGRAATLSPDAKAVLYWTGSWTAMQLLSSNVAGTAVKQLNDGSSIAWNTRWSPDGRRIAFTGKDDAGVLNVFVMNADGTGRRQVTHVPVSEGQAQVPAWSPDGREIAFQTTAAAGKPGFIWIADAETGVARKLNEHAEPYVDEVPSWFPDGKRLAFQSNRTRRMEVWVMDRNGANARQMTR